MYSVLSTHEASTRTIAGAECIGLVDGLRCDGSAVAALARVAAATVRPAGHAQRRQNHPYLDHSGTDDGPAEGPLFGED